MFPKVNQNIVIDLTSEGLSCKSIVAGIEENEILISFPIARNMIGQLHTGSKIDVSYMMGDNKYKFHTEILGKREETIILFRIKKPDEKAIIKIQQREYFRVSTNCRLIIEDNELYTINISGGGILFSCDIHMPLQIGDLVSGTLYIPKSINHPPEPIAFQCKIVRINLNMAQERKLVGVKFTEIGQKEQNRIIQYCMEKQRQNRMKEREI